MFHAIMVSLMTAFAVVFFQLTRKILLRSSNSRRFYPGARGAAAGIFTLIAVSVSTYESHNYYIGYSEDLLDIDVVSDYSYGGYPTDTEFVESP